MQSKTKKEGHIIKEEIRQKDNSDRFKTVGEWKKKKNKKGLRSPKRRKKEKDLIVLKIKSIKQLLIILVHKKINVYN